MASKILIPILVLVGSFLILFQIYGAISTINNNKYGYPSRNDWFTFSIDNFLPIILATILFIAAHFFRKKISKTK